jgi:hypothetical protein
MEQHQVEVIYVLGCKCTEHFIRVYPALEDDHTAVIAQRAGGNPASSVLYSATKFRCGSISG